MSPVSLPRRCVPVWALAAFVLALPAWADPPPAAAEARLPLYPNRSCPIMGKRASTALFVDTEFGRIYMCCKPCVEKILDNPAAAYRAAYPVAKKAGNAVCPITGKALDKDATVLVLQGQEIGLCCPKCAVAARATSQVVLARLANPALRDVGNRRCPVTGGPVGQNSPCLVGDELFHLSGPEAFAAVQKDPAGTLARAKAIAAEERAASGSR